jgi:hypothetical protein
MFKINQEDPMFKCFKVAQDFKKILENHKKDLESIPALNKMLIGLQTFVEKFSVYQVIVNKPFIEPTDVEIKANVEYVNKRDTLNSNIEQFNLYNKELLVLNNNSNKLSRIADKVEMNKKIAALELKIKNLNADIISGKTNLTTLFNKLKNDEIIHRKNLKETKKPNRRSS